MRLNYTKLVQKHPAHLVSPLNMYIDRGGSVESNQLEPMLNKSTHFAISAMMWFKKVRGGSMHFNYTELVQKHPAHLASPLNM